MDGIGQIVLNKIRRNSLLKEISEEEFKKAEAAGCEVIIDDDSDNIEYEYLMYKHKDSMGKTYHYYYKAPKLSSEETKLYLLQHIEYYTKHTEAHTKTISYIIVALLLLDIAVALLGFIIR